MRLFSAFSGKIINFAEYLYFAHIQNAKIYIVKSLRAQYTSQNRGITPSAATKRLANCTFDLVCSQLRCQSDVT